MRAKGYIPISRSGDAVKVTPSETKTRWKLIAIGCAVALGVVVLGAVLPLSIIVGTNHLSCKTPSFCHDLGLPASECDLNGLLYGSSCVTSTDCLDGCCVNYVNSNSDTSPCSSKHHYTCVKNTTTSLHGVCKEVSISPSPIVNHHHNIPHVMFLATTGGRHVSEQCETSYNFGVPKHLWQTDGEECENGVCTFINPPQPYSCPSGYKCYLSTCATTAAECKQAANGPVSCVKNSQTGKTTCTGRGYMGQPYYPQPYYATPGGHDVTEYIPAVYWDFHGDTYVIDCTSPEQHVTTANESCSECNISGIMMVCKDCASDDGVQEQTIENLQNQITYETAEYDDAVAANNTAGARELHGSILHKQTMLVKTQYQRLNISECCCGSENSNGVLRCVPCPFNRYIKKDVCIVKINVEEMPCVSCQECNSNSVPPCNPPNNCQGGVGPYDFPGCTIHASSELAEEAIKEIVTCDPEHAHIDAFTNKCECDFGMTGDGSGVCTACRTVESPKTYCYGGCDPHDTCAPLSCPIGKIVASVNLGYSCIYPHVANSFEKLLSGFVGGLCQTSDGLAGGKCYFAGLVDPADPSSHPCQAAPGEHFYTWSHNCPQYPDGKNTNTEEIWAVISRVGIDTDPREISPVVRDQISVVVEAQCTTAKNWVTHENLQPNPNTIITTNMYNSLTQAQDACCNDPECVGVWEAGSGSGGCTSPGVFCTYKNTTRDSAVLTGSKVYLRIAYEYRSISACEEANWGYYYVGKGHGYKGGDTSAYCGYDGSIWGSHERHFINDWPGTCKTHACQVSLSDTTYTQNVQGVCNRAIWPAKPSSLCICHSGYDIIQPGPNICSESSSFEWGNGLDWRVWAVIEHVLQKKLIWKIASTFIEPLAKVLGDSSW